MLKVEMLHFEDLTDEQKKWQPNNGSGKECATYLKISHDGVLLTIESDAMEPEDCTFYRDLSWIGLIAQQCYELGKSSK